MQTAVAFVANVMAGVITMHMLSSRDKQSYRKLFLNVSGETPSLRLKNCPNEAWSGNPIASATCCMLQSVLSNNFLILPISGLFVTLGSGRGATLGSVDS